MPVIALTFLNWLTPAFLYTDSLHVKHLGSDLVPKTNLDHGSGWYWYV